MNANLTRTKEADSIWNRMVIIISGVLLCCATASAAAAGKAPISNANICHKKGCRDSASTYLKNMDSRANPCVNFYQFACGGFLNSTVLPGDKEKVNWFTTIKDKLDDQLKSSIEAPVEPKAPKPFRLVKNFYKSCMKRDESKGQSRDALLKILKKLGGWPVIDGDRSNNDNFDWKNSVSNILDAGYEFQYLMYMYVYTDLKMSTKQVLYIDQPTLGLAHDHLKRGWNDKIVQAYYSYMVDIAVILGATKQRATTELKEALLFELKLCNISESDVERQDLNRFYNPITVSKLKKTYSNIPWMRYFKKLLPSNDLIKDDEKVILGNPRYFEKFEKILATTPKRVQANYVMWRIVAESVVYMKDEIRARKLKYDTALEGVTERKSQWRECMDIVIDRLGLGVGAMYVKNYFDKKAKSNIVEMFNNIREQFTKTLKQVDWMDDRTRQSALAKLSAMSTIVGYSDEILDNTKLEEYYKNLELDGGNFLEAALNYTSFSVKLSFSKLHKPVVKNDWTSKLPAKVDAYYMSLENNILLPAGILQDTLFGNDRPKYTNYGALGSFFGRLITNGFDQVGSQFDKDGNLVDWWTQPTKEKFVERTKCLIRQYGNYTIDEGRIKLDGERILRGSISDNGGIKAAYYAYSAWADRNPPEQQLPELPYTPKQMFWISAASPFCSKYTPNALKKAAQTGEDPPYEFRIVGPLSNMQEFSKDFNCPIGSNMNPAKKCHLW